MSKTRFQWCVWITVGLLAIYAMAYVWATTLKSNLLATTWLATTMKELIPIVIGIAGALLAYAFNQRISFVSDLRSFWPKLVDAVQGLIQYTHLPAPTMTDFAKAQQALSTAIDEMRVYFGNVGQDADNVGSFPFEDLHQLPQIVGRLKPTKPIAKHVRDAARDEVVGKWKRIRKAMLPQIDRA